MGTADSASGGGGLAVRVGLINGGLEKLTGILLAHLNRPQAREPQHHGQQQARQHRQRAEDTSACYVEGGVHKVHGGTFRDAATYKRVFGSSFDLSTTGRRVDIRPAADKGDGGGVSSSGEQRCAAANIIDEHPTTKVLG